MRILFIIFIIVPSVCESQVEQAYFERQSDVVRTLDGIGYSLGSPLRWKGKDWIKLGGVVAATATLTLADKPIRNFWLNQEGKVLDAVNTVGYHYGKAYSALAFTGGFYVAGLALKDDWARETGLILGTSLFSTALFEMTLKPVVGRARPSEGFGNYEVTFFNHKAGFHSFPSGHAGIALTISLVMARRINYIPVKVAFYSLAASTVICRLYSDAHWVSDVAFGGAVAWFVSDVVNQRLAQNKFRKTEPNRIRWNVEPYASGLTFRGRF